VIGNRRASSRSALRDTRFGFRSMNVRIVLRYESIAGALCCGNGRNPLPAFGPAMPL
jgi:hypothetical protein